MKPEELVGRYPSIFHMAEETNWPSIQQRGLLSTTALLDLYGYHGPARDAIEGHHRPDSVTITAEGLPPAVIRDQKVLHPRDLSPLLEDGLTTEQWYRLINKKVFFWAERYRLDWLLGALAYRGYPHIVIVADTRELVRRHGDRTTLTSINSGSARPQKSGAPAPRRGVHTFQSIPAFNPMRSIVEVAVEDRLDDLLSVAKSAELWQRNGSSTEAKLLGTLWTRPERRTT